MNAGASAFLLWYEVLRWCLLRLLLCRCVGAVCAFCSGANFEGCFAPLLVRSRFLPLRYAAAYNATVLLLVSASCVYLLDLKSCLTTA